jgi:hypothetical protein
LDGYHDAFAPGFVLPGSGDMPMKAWQMPDTAKFLFRTQENGQSRLTLLCDKIQNRCKTATLCGAIRISPAML